MIRKSLALIAVCLFSLPSTAGSVIRNWLLATPFPWAPGSPPSDAIHMDRRFISPGERYSTVFSGPLRDSGGRPLEAPIWGFEGDRRWEVGWEILSSDQDRVDLGIRSPIRDHVISYVMCFLNVSEPCAFWLRAGSHDDLLLVLDGEALLRAPGLSESWQERQAWVFLDKGSHSLVGRVAGGGRQHDLEVWIEDDKGGSLSCVTSDVQLPVGDFWMKCAGLRGVDALSGSVVASLALEDRLLPAIPCELPVDLAAQGPMEVTLKASVLDPRNQDVGRAERGAHLCPEKAFRFAVPAQLVSAGSHLLKVSGHSPSGEIVIGEMILRFDVISRTDYVQTLTSLKRDLETTQQSLRQVQRMEALMRSEMESLRQRVRPEDASTEPSVPEESGKPFEAAPSCRVQCRVSWGWQSAVGDPATIPAEGWSDRGDLQPIQAGPGQASWYRTEIPSLSEWKGKKVMLTLERAGHQAQIWCNGSQMASGFPEFFPLSCDLSSAWLADKPNTLCLSLLSASSLEGPLAYQEQWPRPLLKPEDQSLRSEPLLWCHPALWIEDLFVTYVMDEKRLKAVIRVRNDGENAETGLLEAQVVRSGQAVLMMPWKELSLEKSGSIELSFDVSWEAPQIWGSPGLQETPPLYSFVASLHKDPTQPPLDQASTRFGVRTLSVNATDLSLNGRKILLRAVQLPSSASRLTPGQWASLFQSLREAGANMLVTSWDLSAFLDLADEVGIFVAPVITPPGRHVVMKDSLWADHARTVDSWVRARRNHPSIAFWCTDQGLSSLRDQDEEMDDRLLEMDKTVALVDWTRWVDHAGCPGSLWKDGARMAHLSVTEGTPMSSQWPGKFKKPLWIDEIVPQGAEGRDMEALRQRLASYEFWQVPGVTLVLSETEPKTLLDRVASLQTQGIWARMEGTSVPRSSLIVLTLTHAGLPVPGMPVWLTFAKEPSPTDGEISNAQGQVCLVCPPGPAKAWCVLEGQTIGMDIEVPEGSGWNSEPGPTFALEIP